ncbi:MAG: hypothetical protein SOZ42_02505 [Candidatus Enterosoma sp.]|nr:hypothetical protein [Candidatus Enterosoma sp.]
MFSYSSIKTKDSYNQHVIEEILSRMVEEENNNSDDGFELVANALDVDGKRLYKELVNKTSIMKDNQSSFMVENNYLQIKDYDSIDFDTGEVTNQLAQNEQKIKKFDNVSFWEIEMSRDTCKKIYDTLCRNADSIFRKLQNSELKFVKMIE